MTDNLNIGFLSPHNPFDRTAFSGTAFHVHRALAAQPAVQVRVLGNHAPVTRLARLWTRLRGRRPFVLGPVEPAGLDRIVALTATGLADDLLAQSCPVPIAHVTDATPAFLREFYGHEIPAEADAREARVVRGAAWTVYSSDYMARRAVTEFGVESRRVRVVPFGTNIDPLPEALPEKPPLDVLRLLWVGSGWERKGGVLALETFAALRAQGRPARLTLVGDVPTDLALPEGVERVGYLDKNDPAAEDRLNRLFAEAHLFMLPTRADCTPMVVAEANAWGTPVLITDTGGIASLMASEGGNGRMLAPEAGPEDWAGAIRALAADPAAYAALCRTSFDHARARLTWEAWARDLVACLRGRA